MDPRLQATRKSWAVRAAIGLVMAAGLLGLFVFLTTGASAGGEAKVTVNSTANVDDGHCEGPPNDDHIGNCTLREAINMVNAGDADIINFHPAVFAKAQPGVINLCSDGLHGLGELPDIERNVVIDSKDTGVVLDGGLGEDDCGTAAEKGIEASGFGNGFDFTLNGGKNFWIRNIYGYAVSICGNYCGDFNGESLGTIVVTGIITENVYDEAVTISGSNLESATVTNNEIESTDEDGVEIYVEACIDDELACKLSDSVVDISNNRILGGTNEDSEEEGVEIYYSGIINSGTKITLGVTQNEVINGSDDGVDILYQGCGRGGMNVHVDENGQINGETDHAVYVVMSADTCQKDAGTQAGCCPVVEPGHTSESFEGVVTVNGNGDIENTGDYDGVHVEMSTCCEGSDSTGTVEVNGNGRISGEEAGVSVETYICCGDGNLSDVSVNENDEITGEGFDGVYVLAFAGSSSAVSDGAGAAGGIGFDADNNTCLITVDGNSEIDGLDNSGVQLDCFAGTLGFEVRGDNVAGAGNSSGDSNTSTVNVTNNSDITGDYIGVDIESQAGSLDGEADENLGQATVSGNAAIHGDNDDGIEVFAAAGSTVDEGDDNATEVDIEDNAEVGGDGGNGIDVYSASGGDIGTGSVRNSTSTTIVQNGTIEASGNGYSGVWVGNWVCCDPENTNLVDINNNKGEIIGYDDSGIVIETCCSQNTVNVSDNAGPIHGGDWDGLDVLPCDLAWEESEEFYVACLKDSVTNLTVMNNQFTDSESDGIYICCGVFQDEAKGFKSVISNNVVSGNGDDGIDVESSSGLNIGPNNEIHDNGTEAGDNGVEIDWYTGACAWFNNDNKLLANANTITQNSIYDNYGLGIDLVGFNPDDDFFSECSQAQGGLDDESVVGCVPFEDTAINPNDCIPFPQLKTQSDNKLIGMACSLCEVEIFLADDTPDNNEHHGEGVEYLVSTQADEDGNWSVQLPCDLGPGDLTATATDKLKNTSEFSENLSTLGTFCPTDTPTATNTPVPPTNTPVPPTSTPAAKQCGDVNDDGVTNSIDATLVLQLKAQLVDSLPNEASGDVNGDGALTSIDAALILQYTAALIGDGDLNCP